MSWRQARSLLSRRWTPQRRTRRTPPPDRPRSSELWRGCCHIHDLGRYSHGMVAFAVVAGMLTFAGIVSIVQGLLHRRGIRIYLLIEHQRQSVAEQAERWLAARA